MVSFFISKKQRFVAYSPIIRCLIFNNFGYEKITIVVDNIPLSTGQKNGCHGDRIIFQSGATCLTGRLFLAEKFVKQQSLTLTYVT